MCLAVPAVIVEIQGQQALVDFNGICKSVNIAYVSGLSVGDYILVHAGFAIGKWSESDYREYREIVDAIQAGQP